MIVALGSADLVDGCKLAPGIFGERPGVFSLRSALPSACLDRNGASPFAQLTLYEATSSRPVASHGLQKIVREGTTDLPANGGMKSGYQPAEEIGRMNRAAHLGFTAGR